MSPAGRSRSATILSPRDDDSSSPRLLALDQPPRTLVTVEDAVEISIDSDPLAAARGDGRERQLGIAGQRP
jgi:hypothetical protein